MKKSILFSCSCLAVLFSLSAAYAEVKPDDLFKLLDANNDGKVTESEVNETQMPHFKRLINVSDKNKDGVLTKSEFTEGLKEAEPTSIDGQGRQQLSSSEEQKRRKFMANIEAMFKNLDKNKDGKVTKDEIPEQFLPRVKPLFDRIGKDSISLSDLEEMRKRMGIPKDKNAKEQSKMMAAKMAEELFKKADQNEDGFITIDEVPEDKKQNFKLADANEDGKVTKEELQATLAKVDYDNGGPFKRMFTQLDKDGNGTISKKEAPEKLSKIFNRVDTDNDGELSMTELGKYSQRLQQSKNKNNKKKTKKRPKSS